jgi:hypothetical protein
MPTQHGLGLYDDRSVQQRRELWAKPDQDQTVDVPQPNARSSAVEYHQLLSKDENLRLTSRTSLEHRPQRERNTSEPRQHRALQLAHSLGFVTWDEILTSDSGENTRGIQPICGEIAFSGSHRARKRHVPRGFLAISGLSVNSTDCVVERNEFELVVPILGRSDDSWLFRLGTL